MKQIRVYEIYQHFKHLREAPSCISNITVVSDRHNDVVFNTSQRRVSKPDVTLTLVSWFLVVINVCYDGCSFLCNIVHDIVQSRRFQIVFVHISP